LRKKPQEIAFVQEKIAVMRKAGEKHQRKSAQHKDHEKIEQKNNAEGHQGRTDEEEDGDKVDLHIVPGFFLFKELYRHQQDETFQYGTDQKIRADAQERREQDQDR